MFSFFSSSDSKDNDTLLHKVIRENKSLESIRQCIFKEKDISRMAKTINDKGELPIFMIYSLPYSFEEKNKLQALLLYFTKPSSYIPFSSMILEKNILSRYQHLKNSPVYENIKLSIKAMNTARKLFSTCVTHPELNDEFESVRRYMHEKILDIRLNDPIDYLPSNASVAEKRKFVHEVTSYFSKSFYVNCEELSFAVLDSMYKMNKNMYGELWHILSDDHVFVIFASNTPYAVVCDALVGDVFLVNEIPEKLKAFYRVWTASSYVNCFSNYNSTYHYIEPFFSISDNLPLDEALESYKVPFAIKDIPSIKKNINSPWLHGYTPLCDSVKKNDFYLVEKLLSAKADPDSKSRAGYFPLGLAARYDYCEIIALLLKAKANIENTDNTGKTALIVAADKLMTSAFCLLLANKADPNHGNHVNKTPLPFLIRNNRNPSASIKLLCKYRADLNGIAYHRTPLMRAASLKSNRILKQLLCLKADPNIKNEKGLTALAIASKENRENHVKLLLEYKAESATNEQKALSFKKS